MSEITTPTLFCKDCRWAEKPTTDMAHCNNPKYCYENKNYYVTGEGEPIQRYYCSTLRGSKAKDDCGLVARDFEAAS